MLAHSPVDPPGTTAIHPHISYICLPPPHIVSCWVVRGGRTSLDAVRRGWDRNQFLPVFSERAIGFSTRRFHPQGEGCDLTGKKLISCQRFSGYGFLYIISLRPKGGNRWERDVWLWCPAGWATVWKSILKWQKMRKIEECNRSKSVGIFSLNSESRE